MRASTRLTLFSIFFLILGIIGFVSAVVNDEPAGLSIWGPLILSMLNGVGSSVAILIEKQSRGDR